MLFLLLVALATSASAAFVGVAAGQHAAAAARPLAVSMKAITTREVTREEMSTRGRSTAEVAVGLNTRDWKQEVAAARARGVTAVRVRHMLVSSEDMARELRQQIRDGGRFDELAGMVSACAATRDKGGEVGWSGVEDEHLDEILPRPLRERAIGTPPGDVFVQTSELGVHLVQVVDVFQTLNIHSEPRTKKLAGAGVSPRPLIQLLRASRDDQRDFKQLVGAGAATEEGGAGGAGGAGGDALTVAAAEGAAVAATGGGGATRTMRYSMESMGCQMNSADAERMEGQLRGLGFVKAAEPTDAQVVVLNTCSIREHAEAKVYSYLGPHAKRKQAGEDLAIVVAGCVAQQEGEELLRRVPEIDMVMGPQYANRLGDLLEGVFNGNQIVATAPTHIMEDLTQPQRASTTAAWVNIIYGCNERCTYCVVPTTRGVEQSRPRDAIRAEIESLVADGYKEVTLLGQNIDAWGRDLSPPQKFADLLRDLGATPGLARLRFVTSHPRYMSTRVVDAVAETPALMEMFHIPFQSGDDEILKAMERGHTAEKYLQIVARIRERVPDAAITADAIVGFPGETDEQFRNTLRLMEAVKFDQLNTAAYSPRPHTPAALWGDQVDEKVKKERLRIINELAATHARERRQRYLGRVIEVLVEQRNPRDPLQVKGRNRQGCPVFLDGDIDELKGQLVSVRVTEAHTYYLVGERDAARFAGGRYDAADDDAVVLDA